MKWVRIAWSLVCWCMIAHIGKAASPHVTFEQRQDLGRSLETEFFGDFTFGTKQAGEPPSRSSATLWWEWQAPQSGLVRITANRSLRLNVYQGATLATLTEVEQSPETLLQGFRAVADERYLLRLADSSGQLRGLLSMLSGPPNDDLARAIALPAEGPLRLQGSWKNATKENDEPGNASRTVWWKWQAPSTGILFVPSPLDRDLYWYTSDLEEVRDLTEIPRNPSRTTRFVVGGNTYFFQWRNRSGAASSIDETMTFIASPSNDAIKDATPIILNDYFETKFQTNIHAATLEDHPADDTGHASLWWELTASRPGQVELWGLDGQARFYLSISDGVLQSLFSTFLTSKIDIASGERLYVKLHSNEWPDNDTKIPWQLRFSPQIPGGDFWEVRRPLGSLAHYRFIDDAAKGRSHFTVGETTVHRARWWEWTATETGTAAITMESDPDHAVVTAIIQGQPTESSVELRQIRGDTRFVMPVEAETSYTILVGTLSSTLTHAPFSFGWETIDPASNDNFEQAIDLGTTASITDQAVFHPATNEVGEPRNAKTQGSLWWRWTAPEDGHVQVTASGTGPTSAPSVLIYQGNELSTLLPHPQRETFAPVEFLAHRGESYYLRIARSTFNFDVITLALEWSGDIPENDQVAHAINLAERTSGTAIFENATSDHDDIQLLDKAESPSLWWTWTAPGDLVATMQVQSERPPKVDFALFEKRDDVWEEIREQSVEQDLVKFATQQGRDYLVGILDENADGVSFTWQFSQALKAPNNTYEHATDLGVVPNFFVKAEGEATAVANEPPFQNDIETRWWQWQATSDGVLNFSLDEGERTTVYVYQGEPSWRTLLATISNAGRTPVIADTTYSILVTGEEFQWQGTWVPHADNDHFENALLLDRQETEWDFDIDARGSSVEPGERSANGTLWYRWTSPTSEVLVFEQSGGFVNLFTGSTLGNITYVPNRGGPERPTYLVEPDQSYYIKYTAYDGPPENTMLRLARHAPPQHDDFQNRLVIGQAASFTETLAFAGASREESEPRQSWMGSVWVEWQPKVSGRYQFQRLDEAQSPRLEIYQGETLTELEPVEAISEPSKFDLQGDHVYQIIIRDSASQVAATLAATLLLPPSNDDFENSERISGHLPVVIDGTTFDATWTGELAIAGWRENDAAVWWSWTAPHAHHAVLTITERNSGEPPTIRAFTGAHVGELEEVTSEWWWDAIEDKNQNNYPFIAEANRTYHFAISTGTRRRGEGNFSFRLRQLPLVPLNDDFAHRVDISGQVGVQIAASTSRTATTSDEPGTADDTIGTVWYEWVAPETTAYQLSSNSLVGHEVYTGEHLHNLQLVSKGTRRSRWEATRGTHYQNAIRSRNVLGSFLARPPSYFLFEINEVAMASTNTSFRSRIDLESRVSGEIPISLAENEEVWFGWQAPTDGHWLIRTREPAIQVHAWKWDGAVLRQVESGKSSLVVEGQSQEKIYWSFKASPLEGRAFDMTWELLDLPSNDDFADRRVLTGDNVSSVVYYQNTTLEPNEPLPKYSDDNDGGTLWWEWTAPRDGAVTITTSGSSFSFKVGTFVGETLNTLRPIKLDSATRPIQVQGGTRYFISTAAANAANTGKLSLRISLDDITRPTNDGFINSIDLGNEPTANGTGLLEGTTREVHEPAHRGHTSYGTAWWSWTCTESGVYEWRSDSDHQSYSCAIYTGAGISDLMSEKTSTLQDGRILWNAEADTTYHFAIFYKQSSNREDHADFHVQKRSFPDSDAFHNRLLLGNPGSVLLSASNIGASLEPGDPLLSTNNANSSVWWEWQARQDGVTAISTSTASLSTGSSFRTPSFEVYSGTALEDLEPVSRNSPVGRVFVATAGQRYHIAAYGLRGAEGEINEQLKHYPASGNTATDLAEDLGSNKVAEFTGHTYGMFSEEDASGLWWRWQAPSSERYHWLSSVGKTDADETIYEQSPDGSLAEVQSTPLNDTDTSFTAIAAKTYWLFAFASPHGEFLSYRLEPASDALPNTTFLTAAELKEPVSYTLRTGHPLWWQWEAPRSGPTTFQRSHLLTLFQTDAQNSRESSAFEVNPQELIVRKGDLYHIKLRGSGPGILSVHQSPDHNRFDRRLKLPSESAVAQIVSTGPAGASAEPGEPAHHDQVPLESLWYEWQAPDSGALTLSMEQGGVLAVYQGNSIGRLTPLASGEQTVSVNVIGGELYAIASDHRPFSPGSDNALRLQLESSAIPGYQAWAEAFGLSDNSPWADADGDKILNLVEFAFGRNPNRPESSPLAEPRLIGQRIEFVYERPALRDLNYHYEVTADLTAWTSPTELTERIEALSEDRELVTVSLPTVSSAQYFRVSIIP